jgi:hypothetical protein
VVEVEDSGSNGNENDKVQRFVPKNRILNLPRCSKSERARRASVTATIGSQTGSGSDKFRRQIRLCVSLSLLHLVVVRLQEGWAIHLQLRATRSYIRPIVSSLSSVSGLDGVFPRRKATFCRLCAHRAVSEVVFLSVLVVLIIHVAFPLALNFSASGDYLRVSYTSAHSRRAMSQVL